MIDPIGPWGWFLAFAVAILALLLRVEHIAKRKQARDTLMRHYGIGPDDVAGSYESVSEVDPIEVAARR